MWAFQPSPFGIHMYMDFVPRILSNFSLCLSLSLFLFCMLLNVLNKFNNTCSNMQCHKIKAHLYNTKRFSILIWYANGCRWLTVRKIKNENRMNESKNWIKATTHTHTNTWTDSLNISIFGIRIVFSTPHRLRLIEKWLCISFEYDRPKATWKHQGFKLINVVLSWFYLYHNMYNVNGM